MRRIRIGTLIDEAEKVLLRAGIQTPRSDATQLAAHVLDIDGETLSPEIEVDTDISNRFHRIVERRAERIPLGHLVGKAVLGGVELDVGPGVFVPRVHSERVLASGLRAIQCIPDPVVVDLCAGSGAIALAIAHARPDSTVHAVEFDSLAIKFARRNSIRQVNRGGTAVILHHADVANPHLLTDLEGAVDLITANPPFVPEQVELLPEYSVHHPHRAIFSGTDGLEIIGHVLRATTKLLRHRGTIVLEHGHLHGSAISTLFHDDDQFADVASHVDHDGYPLYSVATRT